MKSIFYFLKRFLLPHIGMFGVVLCTGVIAASASGMGVPLMVKYVFPVVFHSPGEPMPDLLVKVPWLQSLSTNHLLLLACAAMPAVFVVRGFAMWLNAVMVNILGIRILERLRMEVFCRVQELPIAFMESRRKGDIISRILAEDIAAFTAHGLVCKLVSTGKCDNGVYSAYVQPTLFPQGAPESAGPSNYNLITLVGEFSERMSFYGQGAGRYPTAYNVVQDCADVLAGKGFYAPHGGKVKAKNTDALCYYVRGCKDAWLEENTAETWGDAVVTKPVSVEAMHQWLKNQPNAFIAAFAE